MNRRIRQADRQDRQTDREPHALFSFIPSWHDFQSAFLTTAVNAPMKRPAGLWPSMRGNSPNRLSSVKYDADRMDPYRCGHSGRPSRGPSEEDGEKHDGY